MEILDPLKEKLFFFIRLLNSARKNAHFEKELLLEQNQSEKSGKGNVSMFYQKLDPILATKPVTSPVKIIELLSVKK